MASSQYFIKIKTPYNVPVLHVNEFYNLELFRSEFGVGSLYVDFPLQELMRQNISTEWRLEVYRRTVGGELIRVGDTQWIVKLVRYKVDEQNETRLHILAYDAMYLLDRRIVAYVDGTPQTSKTMPADDMLKEIVRENLGALASDYHRDLSEWLIVEPNTSTAPVVTKSEFGLQKVLPVLNDICELSNAAGMYLSYDIVYDESIGKLVFRTYPHQRGADRGNNSFSPVYLAHHTDPVNVMGSGLNYASIEIDATDERSYVYSGRQAKDVNAIFAEIGNDIVNQSGPFARSEDFITTGESVEYNDVMTEAHAWLQHKFRNLLLNAHIQEANDMQFGIDYGFGDILALRYLGTTHNIHLDEFKIVVDGDGKEEISVISTNTEKELLIPALTELDDLPLVKNEPLEDAESVGAPLFYRYHTVAQSFALPVRLDDDGEELPNNISYIKVMMRRSGLPERGVSMRIMDSDGADGMPGTVLATAPLKPFDAFADGLYTWARFEFNPVAVLASDHAYWIALTCGIAKDEYRNYYRIGVDPEKRYPNGSLRASTDGTTFEKYAEYAASDSDWSSASADLPFKTYKNSIASQNATNDSSTVLDSTVTEIVQQVWLTESEITNIEINAKRTGLPGNLVVSLCEWDASSGEPGITLASTYVDSLDISSSAFGDHDFTFSSPELLSSGKLYCIVISSSGLSTENYYNISIDTGNNYLLGAAYKLTSGAYVALGSDIYFKVYKLVPDISYTTFGSEYFDVGKTNDGLMQTFEVSETTRLFRAGVYTSKVGSPSDLRVSIYELLDGKPQILVDEFLLNDALVGSAPAWYEGDLSGETIVAGKTYGLTLACNNTDDNNYYAFRYDENSGYYNGVAFTDAREVEYADSDMLFRIGQKMP